EAIVSGALREGVRLPASRTLSRELRVSRGVVSDAYGQLESQGFLIMRARAGGPAVLDYRKSRGERALREALADHLGRTRGVIADPEQILIVQGTAQSVDLLLRVLRARGATRVA